MPHLEIRRLREDDARDSFCCGDESLDAFFCTCAGQYERRHLGRTYVAIDPDATCVLGFYTISAGSLGCDLLPRSLAKKLPKHPLPTVHIGRLAVDQSAQGKGIGEALLMHALHTALELSSQLGVCLVDVRALHEKAADFYRKYGFLPLEDHPLHLFLPMATVQTLFDA